MKTQIHTLGNGLKVILVDTKAFPSITSLLLVGAGSRYENEKNNGIAHFFEHMAFKGSKKYPTSMILASTIEGFGGVFNAFTSKDHTGYWIKAPVAHFETVIDVISDMILYPLLAEDEINREKGVIVEEINMYEDTPYRKVGELYEALIYANDPLGYDIAGTKQTVNSFDRQTFVDYIDDLYHPNNSVLVIAGGFESGIDYLKIVEDKFKGWANGGVGKHGLVVEKQSKPQIALKYKKTEQAHFCVGFRAYSRHDKRKYGLSVLSALLGGGMSSRLFYEVRERRGLCYYISTSRDLYEDTGNMVTQAGVTISLDKVQEALEVTLKEHKKVKDGAVTADELDRAKELIKGRMVLSLEDSATVAGMYGQSMLLDGEIKDVDAVIKEIEKVTLNDIVTIASDIFVDKGLNMAMIGPFDKNKDFEDILHI